MSAKRDFTVRKFGVDSSGRDVWLTQFMHDWLEARWENLGFRATLIQGCFMTRDGGGAKDSSGYHDQGGCVDFRTRDLTRSQIDAMVREFRDHGGALWRRDKTPKHGGMDPHAHLTLGDDFPLSPGAVISWNSYVTGGDGLAGPGRDYEYRPHPLVLTAPEEDMAISAEDVERIAKRAAELVWEQTIQPEGEPKPRLIRNAISKIYTATKKS